MVAAAGIEEARHPAVAVAAAAVSLMMPAAVFAPLGEAALGACVGAALLVRLLSQVPLSAVMARLRHDPLVLCFAALFVWAAVSVSWSPGGAESLRPTIEVAGTTLAGIISLLTVGYLNGAERRLMLGALMGGLLVGGGLMAFEVGFDGPISRILRRNDLHHFYNVGRFKRGLTVLTILLWPALYYLRLSRGLIAGLAVLLVSAAIVTMSTSRASILGLALAVVLGGAALIRYKALFRAGLWLLIGGILLGPALVGKAWGILTSRGIIDVPLEKYELGRLGIWDYAADLFLRSPFLGWGMDASRYIPPDTINPSRYRHLELHPHNAALQIALELGLPGLLIVFAGLCVVVRRTLGLDDLWQRASAIAMLVSVLLVCAVGYGVWQVWWQATAWLAVMLLALTWREGERSAGPGV